MFLNVCDAFVRSVSYPKVCGALVRTLSCFVICIMLMRHISRSQICDRSLNVDGGAIAIDHQLHTASLALETHCVFCAGNRHGVMQK